MLPFNQPSTKMQPPSFLQIAPMASLALLFVIAMMLGWMQNQAGRARTLRLAMSLCLILMPIVAATVLVGCGGGSSSPRPRLLLYNRHSCGHLHHYGDRNVRLDHGE